MGYSDESASSRGQVRSEGTGPRQEVGAVQRLFLHYTSSIRGYLYTIVPPEADAEELFQQVFVVAVNKADEYDPERPFLPWIFGLAKMEVLSWLRDRQRESNRSLSTTTVELLTEAATWDEPVEPRLPALRQCLQKLSPAARHLLKLRYVDEMEGKTIAKQRGIKVQSVYNALDRARARLRDCIEKAMAGRDR
jgi:RNA polymerase sigma-70 factor (ECF subfamily)